MITEEGRHIYHRNNNGLEDSEDYASFYGSQFANYYNRVAGDTPLVMIGSELGYNAGQLGNDWEDKTSIFYHKPYKGITDFGHISIEVDGIVYNFGRYDPNATWGLLRSKGDAIYVEADRSKYLNMYEKKQDLVEYELNFTREEEQKIKEFFKKIQESNRGTYEIKWAKNNRGIRLNKKYDYDLLGRNCTTITIVAINSSTKDVNLVYEISPSGLKSYLDLRQQAERNGGLMLESQYNREPYTLKRKIIKNVVIHKKKN